MHLPRLLAAAKAVDSLRGDPSFGLPTKSERYLAQFLFFFFI
jgi:hypothetical protein